MSPRSSAFTAFLAVFCADLLVRAAYMTGKSPVLPVFASSLGANEVVLGMIVSVSTATGVLLKPLFGFLSDRSGRRIWLLVGTALFAVTPFLYVGVDATSELVALRLFHGLATAIYGPVTLALVAGLSTTHRAESFGWFGIARTLGYVTGPLLGGVLLSFLLPYQVFMVTGVIAFLAFMPLAVLCFGPYCEPARCAVPPSTIYADLRATFTELLANRPLLAYAVVETTFQIGIYAVKTFLPLMVLASGGTALEAGVFLSVQETANAVIRPISGRAADRHGEVPVAVSGLATMAVALFCLPYAFEAWWLSVVALGLGIGQGVFSPSALSLVAGTASETKRGATFGVVGAMRNAGKIVGPVAAGVLLFNLGAQYAFAVLGLVPVLIAAFLIRRQVSSCAVRAFDLEAIR